MKKIKKPGASDATKKKGWSALGEKTRINSYRLEQRLLLDAAGAAALLPDPVNTADAVTAQQSTIESAAKTSITPVSDSDQATKTAGDNTENVAFSKEYKIEQTKFAQTSNTSPVLFSPDDITNNSLNGHVSIVADSAHGSLSVDPNTGVITYTPKSEYVGLDKFLVSIESADLSQKIYEVDLLVSDLISDQAKLNLQSVIESNQKINDIIFIDGDVTDYQKLLPDTQGDIPYFILKNNHDGLTQINWILNELQRSGAMVSLDSIHILSHGEKGELQVGSTTIDSATLSQHNKEISELGEFLSEEGDILLYGCDIPKDDSGAAFIKQLSDISKADITVSTDYAAFDTSDSVEDQLIAEQITLSGLSVEDQLGIDLDAVWSDLQNRANYANFIALLTEVYGLTSLDAENFAFAAANLANQIASGDQLGLRFEIESGAEMGSAAGAYAAMGDDGVATIYVNGSWVVATGGGAQLQRVLLEEIGHSFDVILNANKDTVGDEGELFSNLFLGSELTLAQRALISNEDDSGTLMIDGQLVEVEQAISGATLSSISSDTGTSSSDFITSTASQTVTFTITGSISSGGYKVQYALNGGTWTDATLVSGSTYNTGGTPLTLVSGSNTIAVREFKNAQTTIYGPFNLATITLDTTAPTTTGAVTAITDNVGIVTGTVASGGATDDTSLALSGTLTTGLVAGETVRIYDGATYLGNAVVSGTTWTYTDSRTLTNAQAVSYTARVSDAAGNQSAAGTAYTATVDTVAPLLQSSSPADNATAVAAGSNIVLTFGENVSAGIGNITISNGIDTRTISITDATQVTISGTQITINPTADLQSGSTYYVQVANTALRDAAGNLYAGILNTTTLDFTTASGNSAPVNTVPGTQSVNEDTALSISGISVNDANANLSTTQLSVLNGAISVSLAGGATISSGANGSSTLTLSGTQTQINAALATVSYQGNLNYNGSDTLTVLSTDANAATDSDTVAITVNAVNDAPTATNLSASETYTEDTALNLTNIVISDVDSANVTATLTLSDTAAGSLSTAASGAVTSTFSSGVWTASGALADVNTLLAGVTFTPAANFNSNFTIATSVSDGVAAAITGTKVITGTAINDEPVVTTAGVIAAVNEDSSNSSAVALWATTPVYGVGGGSDESSQTLSYTITAIPSFIELYKADGTTAVSVNDTITAAEFAGLKYKTIANANGTSSVTFDVIDSGSGVSPNDNTLSAQSVSMTVTAAINDAPTVANPIADQTATEDAVFSYEFASNTFNDVNVGDTLTYSATLSNGNPLPGWLSFNAATRTFSGTPTNGDVGSIAVKVTATDTASATVSDEFAITVNNTNDAPTVANPIADQTATEDSAFNYQFANNAFADVDVGDTLTYSATLSNNDPLPSWLSFNTTTRTFSGTPTNGDVGNIIVKVASKDSANASVFDEFNITVNNVNNVVTTTHQLSSLPQTPITTSPAELSAGSAKHVGAFGYAIKDISQNYNVINYKANFSVGETLHIGNIDLRQLTPTIDSRIAFSDLNKVSYNSFDRSAGEYGKKATQNSESPRYDFKSDVPQSLPKQSSESVNENSQNKQEQKQEQEQGESSEQPNEQKLGEKLTSAALKKLVGMDKNMSVLEKIVEKLERSDLSDKIIQKIKFKQMSFQEQLNKKDNIV